MGIPGSANFLLAGGGAQAYQIEQSLRFETNSATEMQKNFSVEGSRDTCTTSVWIKRGRLEAVDYCIWSSREMGGYWEEFTIYSDGSIYAICKYNSVNRWYMRTNAVLRDPSAWYHLVYVRDTSNTTQADRIRIYVNGVRIDSWAVQTEPASSGLGGFLGGNFEHKLGKRAGYDDETYDGYMSEFHFLDGTARNADSFGEFDNNGVWRPIEYTGGGYGTNGLYLKFDPAATNGIGEDYSGNGHTMPDAAFTTSGTGTDVMSDTPTTNWCTLSPLGGLYDPSYSQVASLSDGNLVWAAGSAINNPNTQAVGTIAVSSGKWYFEVTRGAGDSMAIGFATHAPVKGVAPNNIIQVNTKYSTITTFGDFSKSFSNPTLAPANGDVVGIGLDIDGGTLSVWINGTVKLDAGAISGLGAGNHQLFPWIAKEGSQEVGNATLNFGQRAFAYTPPTGYKALNTSNLPAPDIADGSDYFQTVTYTGTGATRDITVADNSSNAWQPDLVWIKNRDIADHHALFDSVRGVLNYISSNRTNAEAALANSLTAFNTDGFELGSANLINYSSQAYVAWNWLAGGSGSSNTAGSITSTVSANPSAGFSIVSYTGTGSGATVGHGLGVAPDMFITKNRDATVGWGVYHKDLGGNTKYLNLNDTAAVNTNANIWNSTSPTSTVFSVGADGTSNGTGEDMIAYCFAEVEGYSKFGSYTGNGSTDGPFVYCGFRPAWIMYKRSSESGSWYIYDAERSPANGDGLDKYLRPNSSTAEDNDGAYNTTEDVDLLSNGFKIRDSGGDVNVSGATYIFACFASSPFGGDGVSPATAR